MDGTQQDYLLFQRCSFGLKWLQNNEILTDICERMNIGNTPQEYVALSKQKKMANFYHFDKANAARRANTITLKEAIDQLLNAYQLRGKFNETYLVAHWEKIMGKAIANRTSKVYVAERKLYVQITSAPLRNELVMAKSKIIELINKEVGENVVEDVVFI